MFCVCSGVEHEDEVYNVRQLEARAPRLKEEAPPVARSPAPTPAVTAVRKPLADKPVAVTASLFRYQPGAAAAQTPARPRSDGKENEEGRYLAKVYCLLYFFFSFFKSGICI